MLSGENSQPASLLTCSILPYIEALHAVLSSVEDYMFNSSDIRPQTLLIRPVSFYSSSECTRIVELDRAVSRVMCPRKHTPESLGPDDLRATKSRTAFCTYECVTLQGPASPAPSRKSFSRAAKQYPGSQHSISKREAGSPIGPVHPAKVKLKCVYAS